MTTATQTGAPSNGGAKPDSGKKLSNNERNAEIIADVATLVRHIPEDAFREVVRRLHLLPGQLAPRGKAAKDAPPKSNPTPMSAEERGIVEDQFPDAFRLPWNSFTGPSAAAQERERSDAVEADRRRLALRHGIAVQFPDSVRILGGE